jgi:hypothetical protein
VVGSVLRGWSARRSSAFALTVLLALAGCDGGGPTAELSQAPSPPPPTVATTTTIPVDPGIEDLMVGAGMTAPARRLFLLAGPQIEDHDSLAQSCLSVDIDGGPRGSHTYGCVADGRIHVRAFTAPEIRDLSYVVAAHELLHIVYRRMPAADRARINAELDAARAGNALLEERLAVYTEVAEDTLNEVHSVLGTEFAGLSPALEEHFAQYFDRSLVLAAFQRTLGEREATIRALEARVKDTEAQIAPLEDRMSALQAAGDVRGYNANVPVINALVAEHNAALQELRERVEEYNSLLAS